MNLTLHHFLKEARYLLPRWWLWIVLLVIELLLNLEWLLPMGSARWPADASKVTWVIAFWLAWSHAPEDSPANERRFIATRPLSDWSYWSARALVLIVFIAVPLAIQEALYLGLSHRPVGTVLSGAGAQLFSALGAFAWVLPFGALWRRGQAGLGLLIIAGTVIVTEQFLTNLIDSVWRETFYAEAHALWHAGLGLIALVFGTMLACWHSRKPLSLSIKLSFVAVFTFVLTELSGHWQPDRGRFIAVNQAKAEALAKSAQITSTEEPAKVERHDLLDLQKGLIVSIAPKVIGTPAPVEAKFICVSMQADQDRKPVNAGITQYMGLPSSPATSYLDTGALDIGDTIHQVLHFFPPGTLLAHARTDEWIMNSFPYHTVMAGAIRQPLPALDKPVHASSEFDVRWFEHSKAMDLPVQSGAVADIGDARLEILGVRFDEDATGSASKGSVAMDYEFSWDPRKRTLGENEFGMMLHAPERRLVWANVTGGHEDEAVMRAVSSRWMRRRATVFWQDVTHYEDGQPALTNQANLRLVMMTKRHLGTTRWTWKPEPFVLDDYLERGRPLRGWHMDESYGSFYGAKAAKTFADRLATFPVPTSTASSKEVLRYLFDVFNSGYAIDYRDKTILEQRKAVAASVAKDHPEVILDLPNEFAGTFQKTFVNALDAVITDAQKADVLKRVPEQTWLAELVRKRGWMNDASALLESIQRSRKRLDGFVTDLLMKTNDAAARQRLLREITRAGHWGSHVVENTKFLGQHQDMHPAMREAAKQRWAKVMPLLKECYSDDVLFPVMMGNAEALDLAIHVAALSNEKAFGTSVGFESEELAALLGLPFRKWQTLGALSDEERKRLWHEQTVVQFRTLRASDFEYLPADLRWRKKP